MGMRARDPSRTGTATGSAVSVADSQKSSRNCAAKALISPQAAKQMAKERVASARGRPAEGCDCDAITRCVPQTPILNRSKFCLTRNQLLAL